MATEQQLEPNSNNSIRNIAIAIAAIVLSIALFLGLKTETNPFSLEAQVKKSTPLEVAFNNSKPESLGAIKTIKV